MEYIFMKIISNLAKLDNGLAESPTVMVGETKNRRKKLGKIPKIVAAGRTHFNRTNL